MIPPVTLQPFVPVNPQLDPIRPTPDIAPVAPAQPASTETDIDLRNREREDAAALVRAFEERRKRQERNGQASPAVVLAGDELNADNTVPAVPLMEAPPRQGLWVDLEV
ncbi:MULTISPECIES: aspartate-semialdehyde dehydrogenase [Pseudomonas]|uniref:Aspartate-semialdehyde dehydrogenase n=1 Tax=Pseudomonas quercus TaxID=2722792 RepID=A0ABX0YCP8_9PSED|nr:MULTISPECIES: aspartate-semialdehyde dehydrogenase [Pseudomonas]MBF7141495.1 aspartate-semialdehyde dehydrogenase [Pseudomonas sp. LY10J]NJP00034.1 aspartate-semialdehyde dehydrogenase [Pseudomonas quercus]